MLGSSGGLGWRGCVRSNRYEGDGKRGTPSYVGESVVPGSTTKNPQRGIVVSTWICAGVAPRTTGMQAPGRPRTLCPILINPRRLKTSHEDLVVWLIIMITNRSVIPLNKQESWMLATELYSSIFFFVFEGCSVFFVHKEVNL